MSKQDVMEAIRKRRKPPSNRKRVALTAELRKILSEVDSESKQTRGYLVMEALILAAENGKIDAIKLVMDRVEGQAIQVVDNRHSGHLAMSQMTDKELERIIAEDAKTKSSERAASKKKSST